MNPKLVRRVAILGALATSLAIVVERRLLPLVLDSQRLADGSAGALDTPGTRLRYAAWEPPEALGGDADSAERESRPAVSPDGRWIAFSGRGAGADTDLYLAKLEGTRATEARRLRELASDADEIAPSFGDGRLYFASNRPGGAGGFDLYVADFDGESCAEPVPLGAVNTEADEVDPWPDGARVYFASRRASSAFDLFVADLDASGGASVARLDVVCSNADEREPCAASAGRALYFASDRGGDFELLRSLYDRGAWLPPEAMPELSSAADERAPSASQDGLTLYFERSGQGADIGRELLFARTRELFQVPVRANGWYDLALAGALALAALLAWLAERWNQLDVIWKCWLASILAHALALWALRYWHPEGQLLEAPERGGDTFRVRLERPSGGATREREGELTLSTPPTAAIERPARAELAPYEVELAAVTPAQAAAFELESASTIDPVPAAPPLLAAVETAALAAEVALAEPSERARRFEAVPESRQEPEARGIEPPQARAAEARAPGRAELAAVRAVEASAPSPRAAAPLPLAPPLAAAIEPAASAPRLAPGSEDSRAAASEAPVLAGPVESVPARSFEPPGDVPGPEPIGLAPARLARRSDERATDSPARRFDAPAARLPAPEAPELPPAAPFAAATLDREAPVDAPPPLDTTPYRARFGPAKEVALREHGGGQETERAVASGLAYLASRQRAGGEWGDVERYHDKYRRTCIGASGLAMLAFLGAGHTHVSGTEHSGVVERAVRFLLAAQDRRSGHFGDCDAYGHGIATYALAECFAITHDERLRAPLERALVEILRHQLGGDDPRIRGGWSYFYPDGATFDPWPRASITAWQVMALESARIGGLEVPDESLEAARRFLLATWDRRHGAFRYSHDPERLRSSYPILPGSTPAALFALSLLGDDVREARFDEAVSFVVSRAPRRYRSSSEDAFVEQAEGNLYFWYYGSLALLRVGGSAWERWNEALKSTLLPAQAPDGSWRPLDVYCEYAGDTDEDRIFATAACTLSLEVYYRYFTPLLDVR